MFREGAVVMNASGELFKIRKVIEKNVICESYIPIFNLSLPKPALYVFYKRQLQLIREAPFVDDYVI